MVEGVSELPKGFDVVAFRGIGCGGQIHRLVALDRSGGVLRPAILWNDGRTAKEVDYLNEIIGRERLSALTVNIAFASVTAPKLPWMKANEPELFAKSKRSCYPSS